MEDLELANAAYDTHLPTAMALSKDEILPYRIDPDVPIINVKRGVKILDTLRA